MSKNRQSYTLSHWYAIDEVLFGDKNPKTALSEQDYNQYIIVKGSLLSTVHELYKKLNFDKKLRFKNLEEMVKFGINNAKTAKSRATAILLSKTVSEEIRDEIKGTKLNEGVTVENYATYLVGKKRKEISLDTLMLESVLLKTGNKKRIMDMSGKISLDAYKIFRDSIIKYSL